MNTSLTDVRSEPAGLALDQAVELIWEWRKYRNEVFWGSVYRWGAVVLALTVLPYLLPDIIAKLGLAVLVFPVLACLLAVFAAYVLIVQYMLYKLADRKYRSLLGSYNPGDIPDKPINRLFRISIGKVLAGVFLLFAIVGQGANALVLTSVLRALP
jgi:hypothetical protein